MNRAVVTGISGQDGSYLAERLISKGWEIHALVRPGEAHTIDDRVIRYPGDLSDLASLDSLITQAEPHTVFNLAGVSSVARSWQEPALTAQLNGTAVAQLLQSAWSLQDKTGREVRFVQASSSEIFGGASVSPQTETTRIDPMTPYGAAKAFAHSMVQVFRKRGLTASSAILYNHESPRRPAAFVSRKITRGAARIAAGLDDHLVLGNMEVKRDWGWAPDYVDALVLMGESRTPDDFVIATGVSHSVRDFAAAAFNAAGIREWEKFVTTDEIYSRPNDAPQMLGDATKAREVLGWKPTVSFDEIVIKMVASDLEALNR